MDRVRAVRLWRYGDRGRSAFARDLGIPISSLNHYETDRTPPAELLVAISRVAGVRLEWLLTGTGSRDHPPTAPQPTAQVLLDRISIMLEQSPELTSLVEEFLGLLDARERSPLRSKEFVPLSGMAGPEDMIPLVGSTAAGPAHFWSELAVTHAGPSADALLEGRLDAYSRQEAVSARFGRVEDAAGDASSASLVQYSTPDQLGFLEFLNAPGLKQRHPLAVAWRIDGDSMSPRYHDRDLVVTSPQSPAIPHQPCVARQRGQIGVNCKLYVPDGNDVLMIPINDRYPVQRVPAAELIWTQRVLARIRLNGGTMASY